MAASDDREALEQVEHITESSRDNGEDLLESEDLKRQLRDPEFEKAFTAAGI